MLTDMADRITNMDEVRAYQAACRRKRPSLSGHSWSEKTGVRLEGVRGINPVNGREIPIYIADYVMMGYGTGAIMAVPAHDERDYAFAKKFGIDIIPVIRGGDVEKRSLCGRRGDDKLRFPQRTG